MAKIIGFLGVSKTTLFETQLKDSLLLHVTDLAARILVLGPAALGHLQSSISSIFIWNSQMELST